MRGRSVQEHIDHLTHSAWTAGVVGLGYVGLPLLLACARQGLACIGFDISQARIEALNRGESHVDDISAEDLHRALTEGVEFTTDPLRLSHADVLFICVPSPLGRNRQPDLSLIEMASLTVGQIARSGQLIVLESTSYPGTTEEFILPAVRSAGLEIDRDVFVAFSPERLSPGDQLGTTAIPRVVGGVPNSPDRLPPRPMVGSSRRFTSSLQLGLQR